MSAYWRASRSPLYGVAVGLPLLLLYEGLIAWTHASLRNGAEVWLWHLLRLLPLPEALGVWTLKAVALSTLGLLGVFSRPRPPLRGAYLGLLLLEATAYSLALGGIVIALLGWLPLALPAGTDPLGRLALSFGAGFYEELLFRVLLFGGLFALLRLLGRRALLSGVLAGLVSALLFAAAHHWGSLGEPFDLYRFVYRTVAGLLFTGIYAFRGFGIVALTHALYNVWIVLGVR